MNNPIIKTMNQTELELALKRFLDAGLDVSIGSASAYFNMDPLGYKLLLVDNKPIGSISVVQYLNFAFVGLFMIEKSLRGQGYGSYLWREAMHDAAVRSHHAVCMGLYAVPDQIKRYQKEGFQSVSHIQRWMILPPSTKQHFDNNEITAFSASTPQLFNEMMEYDQTIFFAARNILIEGILQQPDSHAFTIKQAGKITGYGIIRKCYQFYRIGPLYANTLDDAAHLLNALINSVSGSTQSIILDMPVKNPFTSELIKKFGLHRVVNADCELMIKGQLPTLAIKNITKNYAVCSLELG